MAEHPPAFVGSSQAIRAIDLEITAAARTNAKVLITGESGSGKDLAAHLIHHRSARRQAPLLALNCAGVPDSLLESELFGYTRGSFTDAYRDRPGLLEGANGGTVFLDEVGEMSLRMQALLLRFLESGEVQRIGADRPVGRLDVRVICATNRVLADRIAAGQFREDLYFRLNVVRIHMPPLRDRRDDLPEFIDHFVKLFSQQHRLPPPRLSDEAFARLLAYDWPGNIREVKNVLERLVVRAHEGVVTVSDLPPELRYMPAAGAPAVQRDPIEALNDAVARLLYRRMIEHGESFWVVVHQPFMNRDLTREVVRKVVALGLEHVAGRYNALSALFHTGKDEYKRFLNFLRKHECLVPYQPYRRGDDGPGGAPGRPGVTHEQVA